MKASWRSVSHASRSLTGARRRLLSTDGRFEVSDFAILKETQGRTVTPTFLGPLTPGKAKETHKGRISHDDIIGKHPRDVYETTTINGKSNARYRLHEVHLEDYVLLSKRLVTPIYPHDANLIVSLFDLHPEPSVSATAPQIELLEAGTGHGSLTIHLSRAVYAANGASPKTKDYESAEAHAAALAAWKARRQAVIHSIERSNEYSKHASKTVRGFRQGQYHGNVDFHVSDVGTWVRKMLDQRGQPFLTHTFLDLPNVQNYVAVAAAALKTNGTLIAFCPSITQINDCALTAREDGTLDLDRVVELGVNGGSGGRLWDVRLVKPRKPGAAAAQQESDVEGVTAEEEATSDTDKDKWHMICRPKVGDRITGGGFLAVFKKKSMDDKQDTLQSDII